MKSHDFERLFKLNKTNIEKSKTIDLFRILSSLFYKKKVVS